MNLSEIIELLALKTLATPPDAYREVTGGYAGDLLSCVMAGARAGNVWITIQGHPNIVAVAALLDLAGIIVSESSPVEGTTIQKALDEGIGLFSSPLSTYAIAARLARAGLVDLDA